MTPSLQIKPVRISCTLSPSLTFPKDGQWYVSQAGLLGGITVIMRESLLFHSSQIVPVVYSLLGTVSSHSESGNVS